MRLKELLQAKRAEILKVCDRYGACKVRIFGSAIRGEAEEETDVDFRRHARVERTDFECDRLRQIWFLHRCGG